MSQTDKPAGDEKSADVEYKNLGEAVEERRLTDIFNTREKVRETRDHALQVHHSATSAARIRQAKGAYRSALETYFTEVEPLFRQTEEGEEILEEVQIGDVTAAPPIRKSRRSTQGRYEVKVSSEGNGSEWRLIDEENIPQPQKIELAGISSLLSLPSPVSFSWQIQLEPSPVSGRETVSVERTVEPEFNVLDFAFRQVNKHIAELGFGVEVTKEQQTRIDKELIEDLEEWRSENT